MTTTRKGSKTENTAKKKNGRRVNTSDDSDSTSNRGRDDGLLIAVVCDIRGFTDLTARVDDYFQSNLVVPQRVGELLTAYSNFMITTQERAAELILQPLKKLKIHRDYAVKSTGDGFLVAVQVASGVHQRMDPDDRDFDPEWKSIALHLAAGLVELVKSAKVENKAGTFGYETREFIREWGLDIGYTQPDKKSPEFRVAGSMAMGIGSLAVRNKSVTEAPVGMEDPTHDDAYGHPVNLAFRLCDLAARVPDDGGECSPYILLDRRVARLLLATKNYASQIESLELSPFRFPKVLKGIEELWCYGLQRAGEI